MRAIRKDYFLDHDHSCYVDQWDWEKAIEQEDRTLANLKQAVRQIWSSLIDAAEEVSARCVWARARRVGIIQAATPPHFARQFGLDRVCMCAALCVCLKMRSLSH